MASRRLLRAFVQQTRGKPSVHTSARFYSNQLPRNRSERHRDCFEPSTSKKSASRVFYKSHSGLLLLLSCFALAFHISWIKRLTAITAKNRLWVRLAFNLRLSQTSYRKGAYPMNRALLIG